MLAVVVAQIQQQPMAQDALDRGAAKGPKQQLQWCLRSD